MGNTSQTGNAAANKLIVYGTGATPLLYGDLASLSLGIGTSNFSEALTVSGSGFFTSNLTVNSNLFISNNATIQNNLSLNILNGASYPQVLGTAGNVLTVSSAANTLYWQSPTGLFATPVYGSFIIS